MTMTLDMDTVNSVVITHRSKNVRFRKEALSPIITKIGII